MNALPDKYLHIITSLKEKIRQAKLKAAVVVNSSLLQVYWEIGNTILEQQKEEGWATKIISRLSADLRTAFSDFKGLSVRNLKYMKAFAEAWPQFGKVQEPLAQIQLRGSEEDTIVQAPVAINRYVHS